MTKFIASLICYVAVAFVFSTASADKNIFDKNIDRVVTIIAVGSDKNI